ncbi:MAG: hypothetical protein ACXWEI_09770 [Mycobacterium sp.]
MRVIVTGGNSGVGKATAGELAVAGHDVVIACRMLTKAHEAAARGRRTASRSWPTYFFVQELARRGKTAYASDPGMTATDITRDGSGVLQWAGRTLLPRIAQSPAEGARSTTQAVSTDLPSGTYIAPRGPLHQWGKPKPTRLAAKARDRDSAGTLWKLSAQLTGCDWQEN